MKKKPSKPQAKPAAQPKRKRRPAQTDYQHPDPPRLRFMRGYGQGDE